MVLAPLVFLGPMMYWIKHRGEEGLPVRILLIVLLKKRLHNLFPLHGGNWFLNNAVSFVVELISQLIILNSGIYGDTEFNFLWMEKTNSFVAYIVLVITHLGVVATVGNFLQRFRSRSVFKSASNMAIRVDFGRRICNDSYHCHLRTRLGLSTHHIADQLVRLWSHGWIPVPHHRNIWVVVFWHGIWNVTSVLLVGPSWS